MTTPPRPAPRGAGRPFTAGLRRHLLALHALALLLPACQGGGPGAEPAPASGAGAVATGNAASTNTLPPPPPVLELAGAAAVVRFGAATTSLLAGSETTVDPRSAFRVELPIPLADARISLLDAGDALVPSAGAREVGQATVLSLTPAAPLAAGARLRLRVDGAASRELHDADGRRFAPLEWQVVVAGEPEAKKAAGRRPARR